MEVCWSGTDQHLNIISIIMLLGSAVGTADCVRGCLEEQNHQAVGALTAVDIGGPLQALHIFNVA